MVSGLQSEFCRPGTPMPFEGMMESSVSTQKINEILKVLPQRYPFLLVDRILETDGSTHMVGLKNVTINEPFFQGHFPDHPVMPGVLLVEALAQVGVILLLSGDQNRNSKLVYFSGIDKCRFRQPVVPGDQLRIEVKVLKQRNRYFKMMGQALVDGNVVVEAELSCSLVDRP
jgi:beta-hydroxyacyl-ACP dehydratase FabZ